jgi:probable HAF family extracellular repeat protein
MNLTKQMFRLLPLLASSLVAVSLNAQMPASLDHYKITDLGTLGGTYSYSYAINQAGVISGGAATPDQTDGIATTGFVWSHGHMTSLGDLGGAACRGCISEGSSTNIHGVTVAISETAFTDQNGEDFCGFGTHRQCLAAKWKNGSLHALPVLKGGHNSQVYWINNAGESIGFSETGVPDTNCAVPSQIFRFKAVKWDMDGTPHGLRPLMGDTVSFAVGINNYGQAVGVSGLCSNTVVPPINVPAGPHAVLWEKDGTPIDLGTLPGGVGDNVANSINDRGDVVGTEVMSDGTVHAFYWNKATGLRDLGLFPGSFLTVPPCCNVINNHGLMTGFAIGANGPVAFLWKNGTYTDLNNLISKDSGWYLTNATSINDSGQITGYGVRTDTGELHAFLATPIEPDGDGGSAAQLTSRDSSSPQEVVEHRLKAMQVRGGQTAR